MEKKMKKTFLILVFTIVFVTNCNSTEGNANPRIIKAEDGNKSYDVYIPISTKYNKINIQDFSNEWESFCVFDEDFISEKDSIKLKDVRNDGSNVVFNIQKDNFIIICGLYCKKDGNNGAFLAKLNNEKNAVLELLELNDGRDKLIYLEDRGDMISIIIRLYSVNLYYVDYDDITILKRLSYD